jgi:hypothetical protein
MQQPPRDARGRNLWAIERAIVLQVLRDDRDARWSRLALVREIPDSEPALIDLALVRLRGEGILASASTHVRAAPATRRLDELELIAV